MYLLHDHQLIAMIDALAAAECLDSLHRYLADLACKIRIFLFLFFNEFYVFLAVLIELTNTLDEVNDRSYVSVELMVVVLDQM